MGMMSEFKEFAMKGSVVDLAVGMIIGGAFAKITDSLVKDIIMPIVSAIVGGEIDFQNMYILMGDIPEGVENNYAALSEAGAPMLAYGSFITVIINFVILAFIIFLMIKQMNKLRKTEEPEPEAPAEPSEDILLLREIRDNLNK